MAQACGFTRRGFLRAVGAGAAAVAAPSWLMAAKAGGARKPNIVFILADDLGYGDPRCNNPDSKVPTPNMDRLASEGVRFSDAHSGSAVCTPTRYGVLTGRYSWRTSLKRGVLGGYSPPLIEPGRLTVAAMLRGQGYRTACIGKWHLGLDWAKREAAGLSPDDKTTYAGQPNIDFTKPVRGGPTDVGFDYYFGISASLDMPPYIYIENNHVVGLPTAMGDKAEFLRAGAREPGFRAVDVLPTLTKKAVGCIADHAAKSPDRPLFLYFALTAPHTPVAPADFVKGKSQAGPYGDFVHEVDWTVGEVVRALDAAGMRESTLLIVTSDNGSTNLPMTEFGHLPNGRLRGRKSDIWDGGHREPFLARWPGRIKPGGVCDETICLVDFMATCAAVAGADLPADAAEDSFSVLPALTGAEHARPIRGPVVHHSIDGMFAIRDGRWKLVIGRGSGGWDGKGSPADPPGQLYDMAADPAETKNLYTSEPQVVARLTAALEKIKSDGRSRPR